MPLAQVQHTFGRQLIKAQGPAVQKAAISLLVQFLQLLFQSLCQQRSLLAKIAVPCEAQGLPHIGCLQRPVRQESIFSTAMKASLGIDTVPN